MASRGGHRPQGTDGSDHGFRMIIEDRYKRMALLKKYNRILFYCHVPLYLLLTAWHSVPILEGKPYPIVGSALFIMDGFTCIAFFLANLGAAKENLKILKVYGFLMAILAAEHMLTRFWYHVNMPKEELYPVIVASYLAGAKGATNPELIRKALSVWEATLDGSLWVVLMSTTFLCRSYILEKRSPETEPQQDKKEN